MLKWGIYLPFLVAHASHVLQPLDVACFSPVKSTYRTKVQRITFLAEILPQ